MNKRRLLIPLLLVFFTNSAAYGTTVERLDLDDLVRKAHKIIVGKVSNSRTFWTNNRKLILTSYTVEVQETIKGESSHTLELTTIGGSIGDLTLHVAGMPSFDRGENTLLFVENSGAFSTVVGLDQGKFKIAGGEVSNSVTELSFPDGHPGKSLKMPLESFKKQIKVLIDRQP